jgi:hypothetical protein
MTVSSTLERYALSSRTAVDIGFRRRSRPPQIRNTITILTTPSSSLPLPIPLLSRAGFSCAAILILTVWFGNFVEFDRFSIYADDWQWLGGFSDPPLRWADWLDGLRTYPGGRIGQWSLICLTGAVIDAFDSLQAGYLLLFAVTALAVLATWRALAYRFSNAVALVAAIILAISPLVSIRPFLNGIAAPAAISSIMIATILYASNRRIAAYLVAILAISCYELVFPLFFFLPILLRPLGTRAELRRWLVHVAICTSLLWLTALLIAQAPGAKLAAALDEHSPLGLAVAMVDASLRSFRGGLSESVNIARWARAAASAPDLAIWGAISATAFALLLRRLAPAGACALSIDRRLLAQTLAVLVLMTLAGYALVYFVSPLGAGGVIGRDSRFHSAAAIPLSVLSALILVGLCRHARDGMARSAATAGGALYLGAMFAFSIDHQNDFVRAAERQRLVIEQLALEHPVMDPRALFLIRFASAGKQNRQAIEYDDTHSWYTMLRTLFDFSAAAGPRGGPAICILPSQAAPQCLGLGRDGAVDWDGGVHPLDPGDAGHVWFYELSLDGRLTPVTGPLLVDGRDLLHDGPDDPALGADLLRLRRKRYYRLVMGEDAIIADTIEQHGDAQHGDAFRRDTGHSDIGSPSLRAP